ncbi:hypothetical protein VITU102760_24895 [Vibrio tubiashii]|uniref:Uncharacterized protein n=1 Tax=Vibrio tubiashii ATCC 19109 TaxID=1051646 RepID=F9T6R3_9VIBR|nr:hypothetical protein [Vibrio tubiashii]AIW17538.1 hypothetical protein IX91_26125 [Vibrio tubiashii ATCC 19109]EGU54468.1 hypothetical protein VITU9109_02802 [Vibrio tubiashii ATCC 19109]EIF04225.1 hypothetical protein VT1337_09552 [Vibrio tubiashii NCIMB 1337 = ATCC 19106]
MNVEKVCAEKLEKVCAVLGGTWRMDHITSAKEHHYGLYLSNTAGLFINVRNGDKICKWSLLYKHPKYSTLQTVETIGCSFKNSVNTIVGAIKRRLLSHTGTAYETLQKEIEKAGKERNNKENHGYIMAALDRVVYLDENKRHHHYSNVKGYDVQNADGHTVARLDKTVASDSFDLKLSDLTAEEVIQVLNLVRPSAFKGA